MADRFIGETVKVSWVQEIGFKRPKAFIWKGDEHRVKEITMKWEDFGFGKAPPKKRAWYHRRHRTCYQVLTEQGRVFEMYLDRGAVRETWVLVKELG